MKLEPFGLSAEMTSPFDFYQFWFNTPDEGVDEYLLTFTEIDPAEIKTIVEEHKKRPKQEIGSN